MDRIVRLPPSIRHAHLPEVGVDSGFYRDLSQTFEEIITHLLVTEGLLTILAKKSEVTQAELRNAVREIAAQAGEKRDASASMMVKTEELIKALVSS